MTKANESAFPGYITEPATSYSTKILIDKGGLTKRELFAAMALHGFCNNGGASWFAERGKDKWFAQAAVQVADALLKELEKETK